MIGKLYDQPFKHNYDYVVLGAGITGIATAAAIAESGATVVCVGRDLGGLLRQQKTRGYTFDYGVHVYDGKDTKFHTILQNAGAVWDERKAFYFHKPDDGETMWVPYPVQDFASMMGYPLLAKAGAHDIRNFEDLLIAQVGEVFYRDILGPFNRRVWSTDPSNMDIDWIAGRVPLRSDIPRPGWGPNAMFAYAPGSAILGSLMAESPEFDIIEASVHGVDATRKVVQTYDNDLDCHGVINYNVSLVNTFELNSFSGLLTKQMPLIRTRHNHVLAVGLSTRTELMTDIDFTWAYFDVKERAHRITIQNRRYIDMAPEGRTSFLCEIPMSGETLPYETRDVVGGMSHTVAHYLGLKDDDVQMEWIGSERGYPAPTIGIRKLVGDWKRILPGDVYSVGRWGDHAYFNADQCVRAARHLGHLLTAPSKIKMTWVEAYESYITGKIGFERTLS